MTFQRRIEDFTCNHCGREVKGSGYTNHCPHCLWSTHVDINPGDRAAHCGGMMEPIRLEGSTPHYRIVQRCNRCGIERINNVQPEDHAEALMKIAGKHT